MTVSRSFLTRADPGPHLADARAAMEPGLRSVILFVEVLQRISLRSETTPMPVLVAATTDVSASGRQS